MLQPLIAILAGGRSTRMGSDKAGVEVAGSTMAGWVTQAAGQVGEVLVVGRSEPLEGVPSIPDLPHAGRGPLAGLLAAYQSAPGRPVVLLAVDQPWVRPATLRAMIERYDGTTAVIPVDGGARQTTCALYPPTLHGAAAADPNLASIQRLLDDEGCRAIEPPEWAAWGEDGRSWFSVDDPAALREGLRRFGPPPGG